MPDNRLPTNQSQLDIVEKLDEIKDAIAQGGGGTGGHTIIDENGNSMTARAGLQFVGGANVSDDPTNNKTIVDLASAGGIDGVFIDTSNVIVQQSAVGQSPKTYTATEDCIMWVYLVINNTNASVSVDGNIVFYASSLISQNAGQTGLIPLKKGQTATITVSNYSDSQYTVYGIQTGTTHSKFQPVIYSTEEREIGVWTDGKPLYEKTFIYSNIVSLGNGAVFQTDLSNIDNGFVIGGKITEGTTEYVFPYIANNKGLGFKFEKSNNNLIAQGNDTFSNANLVIIIQYTKTTDVAGSGTWTPQGVPTHHYSTDEQVIGTYLGETLYEKTIYNQNLTRGSWTTIAHSISNIAKIISFDGNILRTSDDVSFSLNYFESTTAFIATQVNKTTIDCKVNISSGDYLLNKITIQYTKSS